VSADPQMVTCPRCTNQVAVPLAQMLAATYRLSAEQVDLQSIPPTLAVHLANCPALSEGS